MTIELYFDGYCPESKLKGKQVEMRLNEDDFWESEETGLQVVISEPYAVLLKWRGKGAFRNGSAVASDTWGGLVMAGASNEEGEELLPGKENTIRSASDLEWYLMEIYKSKEDWEKTKFDPHAPVLGEQEAYLSGIPASDWKRLQNAFEALQLRGGKELVYDDAYNHFHNLLYDLKLVFPFEWMTWKKGIKNLQNTQFEFRNTSLLERSMYLTTIFRSDRFSEGTIDEFFYNGVIQKIMNSLEMK